MAPSVRKRLEPSGSTSSRAAMKFPSVWVEVTHRFSTGMPVSSKSFSRGGRVKQRHFPSYSPMSPSIRRSSFPKPVYRVRSSRTV